MIVVHLLHSRATRDTVGVIPYWLDDECPDSAREQLHRGYAHGGGWSKFEGFTMLDGFKLEYPGDPGPLVPLAEIMLREERILIYDYGWVAIVQPDGQFEVARMD